MAFVLPGMHVKFKAGAFPMLKIRFQKPGVNIEIRMKNDTGRETGPGRMQDANEFIRYNP